jgi:hypothetical protein
MFRLDFKRQSSIFKTIRVNCFGLEESPYLFCSFSGLLSLLSRGEVIESDLADGLFAFSCIRDYIFSDEADIYEVENRRDYLDYLYTCNDASEEEITEAREKYISVCRSLRIIQAAVLCAEREGRVSWRTLGDGSMSYERINVLLLQNNLPQLGILDSKRGFNHFDLSKISPLPVVFH